MTTTAAAERISTTVDTLARPAATLSLGRALVGEVVGAFLLVLFGTGSVAAAVLTGALVGLWQVAVVWGFGVALAILPAGAGRHPGAHRAGAARARVTARACRRTVAASR